VLAGACIGFLPHNFHPARIFMGDTGAMLLGLMLAYGPISSTASLDQNILVNYSHLHPVNRFGTILPLLLPVAILIIPYTDLLLAVIRRTKAGKSPFAADGLHLHHRLLHMGHSHRQSVLLMYLWAVLFSGTVVGLSLVRIGLIWLALATVAAIAVLLAATMPRLRPWRGATIPRHEVQRVRTVRSDEPTSATSYAVAAPNDAAPNATLPDGMPAQGAALDGRPVNGLPLNGLPPNGLPPNGLPGNGVRPNGAGRRAPLPNRRGPSRP
jgi:UDP-GlcNAc:undecaprenyl-phosphate GlcNAc-1-phosphate transferase